MAADTTDDKCGTKDMEHIIVTSKVNLKIKLLLMTAYMHIRFITHPHRASKTTYNVEVFLEFLQD